MMNILWWNIRREIRNKIFSSNNHDKFYENICLLYIVGVAKYRKKLKYYCHKLFSFQFSLSLSLSSRYILYWKKRKRVKNGSRLYTY